MRDFCLVMKTCQYFKQFRNRNIWAESTAFIIPIKDTSTANPEWFFYEAQVIERTEKKCPFH